MTTHYKYRLKGHSGGKLRGHVNVINGRYVLSTICKTPVKMSHFKHDTITIIEMMFNLLF